MRSALRRVFHNWPLKLFSLLLATALWITIASESTSEIAIDVPLEFRNVPENTEIIGESTNTVAVRLRGPSGLIRGISSQDISTTIDIAKVTPGEKIIPLTTDNISAPFGIEVVGVRPSRVRLAVENTMTRTVPVVPLVAGEPAEGYQIMRVTVTPGAIDVQGPETRVQALDRVQTSLVDVSSKNATVHATVELDPAEPLVRIPRIGPVQVEVVIGPVRPANRNP